MDQVSRLDEVLSAQQNAATRLEDVHVVLTTLQASEGIRVETLRDASSQSSEDMRQTREVRALGSADPSFR